MTKRTYRLSKYTPYVVGIGVPDDYTFVGRTELLHWLRNLWLQPQGKPAVAIVGQRRIGKTSLLHKIVRTGLPGTNLLPVMIDVQGLVGDYDFLTETARMMAHAVELESPALDLQAPYAGFKNFLLGLKDHLGERRFLLMLDEADLILERHLGDLLPGFLRTLMQEASYPVVFMFCGTYALRRRGHEYSSSLFNTARFRTLSYLTRSESMDLLQRPVEGILELDPAVLEAAFHLTHGQPLLLQLLGSVIIERFDTLVLEGKERSDYVDLNDLERAAADLVEQQGTPAFEEYWRDAGAAARRVLSALAWATGETDQRQLDMDGIAAARRETRLELPLERQFEILERLAEEEILEREGPTFRFAVPLYRRWIAWHWPPERVRERAAVCSKLRVIQ